MSRSIFACMALFPILFADYTSTSSYSRAAEPSETIKIWPAGKMPGSSRVNPAEPEFVISDRRRPFYQISNVSEPTVAVFLASETNRTGASVLVCPGGGMQRLEISAFAVRIREGGKRHVADCAHHIAVKKIG